MGVTHTEIKEETRIYPKDGCPKDEEELATDDSAADDVIQRNSEWNYDEHGADWVNIYPDCALPQQSPINLIDPVTEYGKSYEIHPSEDDSTVKKYNDLEQTSVIFDPLKYTIGLLLKE